MKISSFFRLLPLAGVLLTACTVTQPPTGTGSTNTPQWHTREQQLQKLEHYQTRGSFAYLTQDKKVYARFFWQQYSPDNYKLLLLNPLGTTELELFVEPNRVQLTDSEGKKYLSDDPESLIYQLTDMDIPLDNLKSWIIGLPGDAKDFQLDANYLLKSVSDRKKGEIWRVNYQGYDTSAIPVLPNRLELTQGKNRIKLKMDNWTTQ
ncbi:lipoprotein localization protein LolB [Xenorhabdus nematophila]|uniref:Outer-membrane lipoprotein LolB n=1 Tax=Xenorhabdus nematophila (strain ATCC 19061 / DSM 3370 / CCUG 14189 / LMG 1036 / NCIMB 9965 / AN6) TaxID=406817 RepID=D3VEQ7_XENNA|nr:lipoprotein insertase outer membrane protein LolB [Xenorhabdus nematophila]CEE91634.1 outer membrane component involved in lipoprotein localization [Xenorhabdus nematophila str. Anatoliense]CEF30361.1 outer membrane component involved in lipoprotein localization [Xenorhabdus nematophila str. Websteri]AYA40341.1 lipoprotein localization protein LolB [Xenorhabdus nematophila]KHD28731.1 membrane protein [Xenorhabdus nematophila]MBA0019013.1 lipoprotein localization protein LolB [Xenorhabdus ne